MRNPFFAYFKRAKSVSVPEARSTAIEKNLGASTVTGISTLDDHEYSFVGGAPQVKNEPQPH